PLGEPLSLIFTIDTNKLMSQNDYLNLPKDKFISVLSTYNPERYFLDEISDLGNDFDFLNMMNGYTKVVIGDSLIELIEKKSEKKVKLERKDFSDDASLMCSFLSNEVPKGIYGYE